MQFLYKQHTITVYKNIRGKNINEGMWNISLLYTKLLKTDEKFFYIKEGKNFVVVMSNVQE